MSTTPPVPPVVPSTPTPALRDLVYEAIQDALMLAGALGVSVPAILQSSAVDLQVASGVAGLIGVAMSLYDRWRTARATHASNVASARLGRAVRPL